MTDAMFDDQLHPTFAIDLPGVRESAENTDAWWRECCDRGIAELARRGVVFQAADLLELGVPEPDSPQRWGSRRASPLSAGSSSLSAQHRLSVLRWLVRWFVLGVVFVGWMRHEVTTEGR